MNIIKIIKQNTVRSGMMKRNGVKNPLKTNRAFFEILN